jgi:hypothetical protein
VPDGEFTAYRDLDNGNLATIRIPADASRSNHGRHCHAEFFDIIRIQDKDGKDIQASILDNFGFKPTEIEHRFEARSDKLPCAVGMRLAGNVRFFLTRAEAELWASWGLHDE